ncbi:hypothetical protein DFH08DRAFT_469958 [Mycena albidolilacea]|uniref:DUF6534 domain-containing protein n=1 Tax=Mycena albidolilacea TaxID=1033008 RepID=A0AAD7EX72_9AGAR|nr:hypothetical protein DFH08DRAFT_469958 [Mycena albidolilacea]
MGTYDDPFGSILIGSWLTSMLYGLVVHQAFQYFQMYPNDRLSRKGLVLASIFFCTVGLVADFADVYLCTVTFWGNTDAVQYQYWPVPLFLTSNTFVGVLVNGFLIHRLYSLSRNLWISVVLFLIVLLGFAGSFMLAITLQQYRLYTARNKAQMAVLTWTISTAVADIGIAAVLIWQLRSMKSTFKDTQSLIKRLIIQAIRTGSTTSVISIITLISYVVKNDSNVETACHFLIGPLYVLTLLYNFNTRQHNQISGSGRSNSEGTNTNAVRMDGIHVHRTALVTVDAPNTDHAGYNDSSLKDAETESYGGNKVPDF